jgi:hypothetical protein
MKIPAPKPNFEMSKLLDVLAYLSLEGDTFEVCRAALKLQVALKAAGVAR